MGVSVSPDEKRPSLLVSSLHQFCTFAGGERVAILAHAKRLRRDYSPRAIHPTDHRWPMHAPLASEAATSLVTSPRSFSARFHGLLSHSRVSRCNPAAGRNRYAADKLGSVEVPGRWQATH